MLNMLTLEEVLSAETEWTQAHLETDIIALDRLMHQNYSIIKPNGTVWDKKTALASYIPGKRDWEEAESTDHTVNVYGDVAVVIGLWKAKGVNNGVLFDYSARYSSVWVKESGNLRMVLDQSTELTD